MGKYHYFYFLETKVSVKKILEELINFENFNMFELRYIFLWDRVNEDFTDLNGCTELRSIKESKKISHKTFEAYQFAFKKEFLPKVGYTQFEVSFSLNIIPKENLFYVSLYSTELSDTRIGMSFVILNYFIRKYLPKEIRITGYEPIYKYEDLFTNKVNKKPFEFNILSTRDEHLIYSKILETMVKEALDFDKRQEENKKWKLKKKN